MMVHDHGKSAAFPVPHAAGTPGVNIREYFAVLALQGMLAAGMNNEKTTVPKAVILADALLAELAKPKAQ